MAGRQRRTVSGVAKMSYGAPVAHGAHGRIYGKANQPEHKLK